MTQLKKINVDKHRRNTLLNEEYVVKIYKDFHSDIDETQLRYLMSHLTGLIMYEIKKYKKV